MSYRHLYDPPPRAPIGTMLFLSVLALILNLHLGCVSLVQAHDAFS